MTATPVEILDGKIMYYSTSAREVLDSDRAASYAPSFRLHAVSAEALQLPRDIGRARLLADIEKVPPRCISDGADNLPEAHARFSMASHVYRRYNGRF